MVGSAVATAEHLAVMEGSAVATSATTAIRAIMPATAISCAGGSWDDMAACSFAEFRCAIERGASCYCLPSVMMRGRRTETHVEPAG